MKKAIMLLVFLFFAGLSEVFAQPMNGMGTGSPGIQQLIVQYGDELDLTDDQKNQLIALQVEHREEFRSNDRPGRRGTRGEFRRDRNGGRRGGRFRDQNRELWTQRVEARLEMRQEVLDVLTGQQIEILRNRMTEQAEKAHEFRTFRHEYMVNEAGIEGNKADQVLNLLNAQSESRLELAKHRILNTDEMNREMLAGRFREMKNTDDELRSILTVDEYENLRKNLGYGNRAYGKTGKRHQRWSR